MESFASFHEPQAKAFLSTSVDVGGDAIDSVEVALGPPAGPPEPGALRLEAADPAPRHVEPHARLRRPRRRRVRGGHVRGGRRDLRRGAARRHAGDRRRDPDGRRRPGSAEAAARAGHGRVRDPVLRFAHLARAFRDEGGASRRGTPAEVGALRYAYEPNILGQAPLSPPSVFGWYRPGYVAPGGWGASGTARSRPRCSSPRARAWRATWTGWPARSGATSGGRSSSTWTCQRARRAGRGPRWPRGRAGPGADGGRDGGADQGPDRGGRRAHHRR